MANVQEITSAKDKIVVFAYQDFANVMTDVAYAINQHSTKYEMYVICAAPHPFDYEPKHHFDYDTASDKEWMKDHIQSADIVIWAEELFDYFSFYDSAKTFAKTLANDIEWWSDENILKIIWHAGCAYRYNKEHHNQQDPQIFDAGLYSPDLYPTNLNWNIHAMLAKPILNDHPKRSHWDDTEIVLMHSPTNIQLKGTNLIRRSIEILKHMCDYPFSYLEPGGPHHEGKSISATDNMNIRLQGHIYIDQIGIIGGVGMSSFEAMASGLVSICSVQNISKGIIPDTCPLIQFHYYPHNDVLNTNLLAGKLAALIYLYYENKADFRKLAQDSISWTRNYCDPMNFSSRFEQILTEVKAGVEK